MSLTNDQLAFELSRRSYLWSSISTLDDTVTSLGFDSPPGNAVNGNTPGETKLWAMPVGSQFIQSTGVLWVKTNLGTNTWLNLTSGTSLPITTDNFASTSGQVLYTLSRTPVDPANSDLTIAGIKYKYSTDYTIAANTLTLVPPSLGFTVNTGMIVSITYQ